MEDRTIYPSHKKFSSPEYTSWTAMKQRCFNKKYDGYKFYGGKGITVCDRWLGKNGFINFLSDMGARPSLSYSLDRFPIKNGNYSPDNCRWATKKEQANNRMTNVFIKYKGKSKCMADWASEFGINRALFAYRIYDLGWSIGRALRTPVGNRLTKSKVAEIKALHGKELAATIAKKYNVTVHAIYQLHKN